MTNIDANNRIAAELMLALECDYDILPLLESLQLITNPDDFNSICSMIELCPMHICDERICADDEITECANLRA